MTRKKQRAQNHSQLPSYYSSSPPSPLASSQLSTQEGSAMSSLISYIPPHIMSIQSENLQRLGIIATPPVHRSDSPQLLCPPNDNSEQPLRKKDEERNSLSSDHHGDLPQKRKENSHQSELWEKDEEEYSSADFGFVHDDDLFWSEDGTSTAAAPLPASETADSHQSDCKMDKHQSEEDKINAWVAEEQTTKVNDDEKENVEDSFLADEDPSFARDFFVNFRDVNDDPDNLIFLGLVPNAKETQQNVGGTDTKNANPTPQVFLPEHQMPSDDDDDDSDDDRLDKGSKYCDDDFDFF